MTKENYLYIQEALEEIKAHDIVWIDIEKQSSLGDYFVLSTATSKRHAHAIADAVRETAHNHGLEILGTEGRNQKEEDGWILIDLSSVIVHIFLAEVRRYYNLEQLWNTHNADE